MITQEDIEGLEKELGATAAKYMDIIEALAELPPWKLKEPTRALIKGYKGELDGYTKELPKTGT